MKIVVPIYKLDMKPCILPINANNSVSLEPKRVVIMQKAPMAIKVRDLSTKHKLETISIFSTYRTCQNSLTTKQRYHEPKTVSGPQIHISD